jgi:hypothetical protein
MEKKESKPNLSKTQAKALLILKFVLGICFLPFVYSISVSFLEQFGAVEGALQGYFWAGVISFLVIHLFIWEPVVLYTRGQKILEALFTFFKPLVKVTPYLVPIYTVLLALIYFPWALISESEDLINCFLFLFGFTITLHIIFSAKSLRSKEGDSLKANYLFGFSFVYILNVAILGFILNLIFDKFSFVGFANNTFQIAKNILTVVFRQLFL